MIHVLAGTGERAGLCLSLGGAGKPGVSVAALDFNWPYNNLIDKCCVQDREGAKGCAAPPAAVQT